MLGKIWGCQMEFLLMAKALTNITLHLFLMALTMKLSMSSQVLIVHHRMELIGSIFNTTQLASFTCCNFFHSSTLQGPF